MTPKPQTSVELAFSIPKELSNTINNNEPNVYYRRETGPTTLTNNIWNVDSNTMSDSPYSIHFIKKTEHKLGGF